MKIFILNLTICVDQKKVIKLYRNARIVKVLYWVALFLYTVPNYEKGPLVKIILLDNVRSDHRVLILKM